MNMALPREHNSLYRIPDNFMDEPRILMGAFKRRNFIEGLILSLLGLIPGLLIPVNSVPSRITAAIICCAPFMIIGIMGYNGDPISIALKAANEYSRTRGEKIYNQNCRVLEYSPTEDLLHRELARDKVVSVYQGYKKRREQKLQEESVNENSSFRFEYDPDIDDYISRVRRDGKKNSNDIRIKQPSKAVRKINVVTKLNMSDFNDLYDLDV